MPVLAACHYSQCQPLRRCSQSARGHQALGPVPNQVPLVSLQLHPSWSPSRSYPHPNWATCQWTYDRSNSKWRLLLHGGSHVHRKGHHLLLCVSSPGCMRVITVHSRRRHIGCVVATRKHISLRESIGFFVHVPKAIWLVQTIELDNSR